MNPFQWASINTPSRCRRRWWIIIYWCCMTYFCSRKYATDFCTRSHNIELTSLRYTHNSNYTLMIYPYNSFSVDRTYSRYRCEFSAAFTQTYAKKNKLINLSLLPVLRTQPISSHCYCAGIIFGGKISLLFIPLSWHEYKAHLPHMRTYELLTMTSNVYSSTNPTTNFYSLYKYGGVY